MAPTAGVHHPRPCKRFTGEGGSTECTLCGWPYFEHPEHQVDLRSLEGSGGDPKPDLVNHPPHYLAHPSGVECIQITEHLNFCLGNAVKYIWRAGEKGTHVQDLEKARWYLDREIARLKKAQGGA